MPDFDRASRCRDALKVSRGPEGVETRPDDVERASMFESASRCRDVLSVDRTQKCPDKALRCREGLKISIESEGTEVSRTL